MCHSLGGRERDLRSQNYSGLHCILDLLDWWENNKLVGSLVVVVFESICRRILP